MSSTLTIAATLSTSTDNSLNSNVNLVDLGKKLLDASRNGETDEVRTLMQSGAPFTTDWLGTSPLHFAAQFGHSETAEVLLRAGISRDARTKVDKTPLHIAAQDGHLAIVSLLIMHGADVDARDMLKMSPLHWAVERGHIDVVDCLLNNGADITLQSKFEKTPIDIAYDNGRLEMVPTLNKYLGQTRLKPEPKPISAPAVKMRPTVLPNKSNRTPKSVKNYQNLNKPVLIPSNFANWKRSINLENVRQILTGSGDMSVNSDDTNNCANPVLATLAALAGAGTSNYGQSVTEALQWLETHGVSMNNTSTDAALFQNALESGQTMSLTEAGKLALSWVKDQQTQVSAVTAVSTASTTSSTNSSNKNSKVITIVADSAQLPQIINSTHATPIVLVSGSSLQDSNAASEAQSHNSSNAKLNRKNASLKLNTKTLTQPFSRVTNSCKNANIKHVLISTSNSNSNDSVSTQLHEIEKQNNKLQHELKIVKQENENYKTKLLEKDCELENYKTKLSETDLKLLEKDREIEKYKKQLEDFCAISK